MHYQAYGKFKLETANYGFSKNIYVENKYQFEIEGLENKIVDPILLDTARVNGRVYENVVKTSDNNTFFNSVSFLANKVGLVYMRVQDPGGKSDQRIELIQE